MQKFIGTVGFALPKNKQDKDFQNKILESTFDMCKINQGVRANFVVNMFMEMLYKYSDFVFECPFPPRTFNVKNYHFTEKSIPTYLLLSDFEFMIDFKIQAKVPKVKNYVYLLALKVFAEFRKWNKYDCFKVRPRKLI